MWPVKQPAAPSPARIVAPVHLDQRRFDRDQRDLEQTLRYLELQARLYRHELPPEQDQ